MYFKIWAIALNSGTICKIYTQPNSKILINGKLTEAISIKKGTCKGHPVLPLLFILMIETSYAEQEKKSRIKGIKDTEYKMKNYADNMFLTVLDPPILLEHIVEHIEVYISCSGYKINRKRTKMINLLYCNKRKGYRIYGSH